MKKLFLFFITIFVMGCTNANTTNSTNKATAPATARSRENIIYESVIATILYNNADYINSKIHTSKTKTHTKSKTDTDIFSTTASLGNSSIDSDIFGKMSSSSGNTSVTNTKIHSKTKSKSTSTSVGVSSGLWF
jgi:hypothetical protein